MKRATLTACAFVLVATAVPVAFGQGNAAQDTNATAKLPEFDVASIRVNTSDDTNAFMQILPNGDGVTAVNIRFQFILLNAYGYSWMEPYRITGIPDSMIRESYDISAKIAPEDLDAYHALTQQQRFGVLLSLLIDRFKLQYHIKSGEVRQYALVVAKNGPKLKEAKASDTYANGLKRPDGRKVGAGAIYTHSGVTTGQAVSIGQLTLMLSGPAGHPVIDKTGLTGKYDFTLEYASDRGPGPPPPGVAGGQDATRAHTGPRRRSLQPCRSSLG